MNDDAVTQVPVMEDRHQLILTWFSVSLDELAVGFALGVRGVSLGLALLYIAAQAFVITFVGLALGQRLGAYLKERAELTAGIVLLLMGFLIIISEVAAIHVL
jgi:manganese efflux pump family protein